jgi:RND family efflux transporter MFP subunit
MDTTNNTKRPQKRAGSGGFRIAVGMGFVGLALLGAFLAGTLPRLRRGAELSAPAQTMSDTVPAVNVVMPEPIGGSELRLPGSVQAIEETAIGARTNGYLRRRYVDIGAKVKAGQLLAEIEAPEVEQELRQAQAETVKSEAGAGQAQAEIARLQAGVAQARMETTRFQAQVEQERAESARAEARLAQVRALSANTRARLALAERNVEGKQADLEQSQARLAIASKTWKRWQQLGQEGAVSAQEVDERQSTYDAAVANVRSAEAAVRSARADVEAARETLNASEADITAAQADVTSSKQSVRAAQAAVQANESNVQAAREAVRAGQQGLAASRATIRSSKANVQRVAVLQGFERIVAPFDGVITSRNVDTGTLISAGGPATSGSELRAGLFGIARTDTLRIQVNVPQSAIAGIRPGLPARVTIREFPGKTFQGQVFHSAGALDANSRTRLTEVRIANPNGQLLPGMYAEVQFALPDSGSHSVFRIPAGALVVGPAGTRVVTATTENRAHYLPVQIGRDFGTHVEVLSGLTGKEQLVLNPSDALKEDAPVRATPLPSSPP